MNEFLTDTLKRMANTFCQSLLGFLTVGMSLTEIEWKTALSVSLVASLVCVLKQVVVKFGIDEGEVDDDEDDEE